MEAAPGFQICYAPLHINNIERRTLLKKNLSDIRMAKNRRYFVKKFDICRNTVDYLIFRLVQFAQYQFIIERHVLWLS
jgi:hypothetical protein